jgi:hypothetical protein
MFCSSVLHLSNPQRHRKVLAQRAHVFASALSCIKNHLKGCGCVNCSGSLAASLVASSAKAYNARETTFYGSHVFREAWTQISKILLNMRCGLVPLPCHQITESIPYTKILILGPNVYCEVWNSNPKMSGAKRDVWNFSFGPVHSLVRPSGYRKSVSHAAMCILGLDLYQTPGRTEEVGLD